MEKTKSRWQPICLQHCLLSNLSSLLRSEILLLTCIKHILKSVSGLAVQLNWYLSLSQGFAGGTSGKESTCQCRRHKRHGLDPCFGKIPWSGAWQPTPAFSPGESHGQRSLEGYSPWGHKESDMTEVISLSKYWCFWTEVLEKTLESPLGCKETKSVNPKGNQPWIFIRRMDAEAEAPILWPPDVKSWLTGKDPDAGKDWGQVEDMAGWHHRLNGHELQQTPALF